MHKGCWPKVACPLNMKGLPLQTAVAAAKTFGPRAPPCPAGSFTFQMETAELSHISCQRVKTFNSARELCIFSGKRASHNHVESALMN